MPKTTRWALILLTILAIGSSIGIAVYLHPIAANSDNSLTSNRHSFVVDATGLAVPVRRYQRIASCSTISDAVLPDLVESERIISVTSWFGENDSQAFRNHGKKRIKSIADIEELIVLSPDLILVSNFKEDPTNIQRLREKGFTVFDMGRMLGSSTLEKNMRDLGSLVSEAQRGAVLANSFHRRMRQVAAHIPDSRRRKGMYLNVRDTQLLGGIIGSSYYDIITTAGLFDIASEKLRSSGPRGAWPSYTAEQVLLLDPDTIVTSLGKGAVLRSFPGLEGLRAFSRSDGVVELEHYLLESPGPGMLPAAEELNEKLYPLLP